jgi:hypothetical protein
MLIIVTGNSSWNYHQLAAAILRRPVAPYRMEIVFTHGYDRGAEESFAAAAK